MSRERKEILCYLMICFFLLAVAVPVLAQSPVSYQYVYDSAGRLTQAVDSSGTALVYAYDAAGNIVSITRQTGVQTAIFGATDANGNPIYAAAPGQQVTLTGIGLGDCPDVTVTVDGIAATVVSKTTDTITILIPPRATAGNIVVSTCHGSATFTLTIGGVVVAPPRAVLTPGQTFQFTASVLPATSNQGVTWSVEGIDGGTGTVGTVTPSGLYTAPATSGVFHVQATSIVNPQLYGEAEVSVRVSSDTDEAFSPGVSVQNGPRAVIGRLSAEAIYVLAPPVSIQNGPRSTLGSRGGAMPVYVLAPPISVQNGPRSSGGAGGGGSGASVPVFVLSPGVSVQPFGTMTGGGGGNDNSTLFIVSPGVSVVPAVRMGRAGPHPLGRALQVAGLTPLRIVRGNAGVVTVRGTHLEDAKALGFVNDAGRLDPNIIIQSAVVKAGGKTMTLRLSVGMRALLGRRRLVVWTLPRHSLRAAGGVHSLP